LAIAIDVEIGGEWIDLDKFFLAFCYICLLANVGDPLAGAVSFKGNFCIRYEDGKAVDRPDD